MKTQGRNEKSQGLTSVQKVTMGVLEVLRGWILESKETAREKLGAWRHETLSRSYGHWGEVWKRMILKSRPGESTRRWKSMCLTVNLGRQEGRSVYWRPRDSLEALNFILDSAYPTHLPPPSISMEDPIKEGAQAHTRKCAHAQTYAHTHKLTHTLSQTLTQRVDCEVRRWFLEAKNICLNSTNIPEN